MLEDDDLLDGVPHDAPEFTDADLLDEDAGEVRWPSLALFCDINLEPETVQQCLGFCRLTSPDAPGDAVARLDADEYARAAVSKAKGNAALFVAQDFVAAAAEYEGALGAYGERGGAAGEQREEKAKICSNLAGSSSSSGRRRPRRRVTRWRSRRRTPRASCVAPRPP